MRPLDVVLLSLAVVVNLVVQLVAVVVQGQYLQHHELEISCILIY